MVFYKNENDLISKILELKNDMKKINFDKDKTEISYRKRSFVYDFLASMRQKINDPLGVRKKRREQGQ